MTDEEMQRQFHERMAGIETAVALAVYSVCPTREHVEKLIGFARQAAENSLEFGQYDTPFSKDYLENAAMYAHAARIFSVSAKMRDLIDGFEETKGKRH